MFRIPNRKALGQEFECKINLLVPGEEVEIKYNVDSTGQDIMNDLARQIDLADKDYYGLKVHDQVYWLDLTKPILKQTKGMSPVHFELRFKYYPATPALLAKESTRYYLYLQLRLDLIEGRLIPDSVGTTAYLIACILQSELGDYISGPDAQDNYVSEFKFVPNQTEDLELASIRLHRSEDFQGLKPADSELNFLKMASQLETYGIDPYPVKEGNSHQNFLIGVNHRGISTFHLAKRTNLFPWSEIERVALDNKLVLIYCRKLEKKGEKSSKSRPLFGFRCHSQIFAQNFWKISTEHRYFFTLETSPEIPIIANTGGLFKKNHRLKYVGRVEKDLLRDRVDETRICSVKRSHSLMAKTNDGPIWQGFQQGNNLQSSLNNLYSSDFINKTLPSNLNCFREEEEDQESNDEGKSGATSKRLVDSRTQKSSGSVQKNMNRTYNRRPNLTPKTEGQGHSIRRGSQIFMDTNQRTSEFVKASVLLFIFAVGFMLIILLINDSDRPTLVTLLVRKMNLENTSQVVRRNYYLPFKLAIKNGFDSILSVLNTIGQM